MTVRELIAALEAVEDKALEVQMDAGGWIWHIGDITTYPESGVVILDGTYRR